MISPKFFTIIILLVFLTIALVLAIAFRKAGKAKKRPIDYYSWFVVGIIWVILGILFYNLTLIVIGAFFVIFGLSHKKVWKKNREANRWEKLTKREQKIRIWMSVISFAFALILAIILVAVKVM